jgi:hypothetical protein
MRRKQTRKSTKLDILRQSRSREKMPRPAVFQNRKKFNRNLMKQEMRREMDPS